MTESKKQRLENEANSLKVERLIQSNVNKQEFLVKNKPLDWDKDGQIMAEQNYRALWDFFNLNRSGKVPQDYMQP